MTTSAESPEFARHARLALTGSARSIAWLDRRGWSVGQLRSAGYAAAMTPAQAREYVRDHADDDDMDGDDLDACFAALYGREPDEQDRLEGLWSHCCAGVL